MSEVTDKLLDENIPSTKAQLNSLRLSDGDIEELAKIKMSLKTKQSILQKDGFLSALLGPVV